MVVKLATSYYTIALLMCLSCLIYYLTNMGVKKRQNTIYILMHYDVILGCIASIAGYILEPFVLQYRWAYTLYYACNMFFFLIHAALPNLFFIYNVYVSDLIYVLRRNKRIFLLFMIPFMLTEIMIITNPLHHRFFTINEEGLYTRGPMELYLYISGGIYTFLTLILLVFFWRSVQKMKRIALGGLLLIIGASILVQYLQPGVQLECIGEALALMAIMLVIENEEKRIDLLTSLYNRNALDEDIRNLLNLGQAFSVTVVKISNIETVQKLSGIIANEKIMADIADFFSKIHPPSRIYLASRSVFAFISIEGEEEYDKELIDKIKKRFEGIWKYENMEMVLKLLIMEGRVPEDLKSVGEIFLLTDIPVALGDYGKVLKGAELGYLTRSMQIEQALKRGVTDHNFRVFYQPIYQMDSREIHSAEALIRLTDPELGTVLPDEFLPIAERNGLIENIDNFVFEETCMFLASGLPVEMGIEYISMNLSMFQCLRQSFIQYAEDTVKKYDIRPDLICFEIKEEAAVRDYRLLQGVIKKLRSKGFRFSMDSFGTGFSDMQSVYSLDFDMIKIDRIVLEKAQEGLIGRIILENCIQMIHEMNRKSLIEGVENEEQVEMCRRLGVDYMQGFYTSKPITRNEFLGILRVTEIARMEERRAIAASEAKSSFLANMSHEIRTPINAVLGMNEMILRECDENNVLEYAKEIENAGKNLLSLINNILDYSKIEASEMEIVNADYDLCEALEEVVRAAIIRTLQKNLEFGVTVSPDIPRKLNGDEFRLRQILMNLLNNAVKYTSEGSISLDVSGETEGDAVRLTIRVSDTGCGIRDEEKDKLFEMFQRLDMEKNTTIEGSGLGLAITHNLLEMMGGGISVKSVYGEGSEFEVNLKQRVTGEEKTGDFNEEYMHHILEEEREHRNLKISGAKLLVVDDTPINHEVIKELLKKTGAGVDCADTGYDALKLTKLIHYDLILMDQRMPGMNGAETLKAIREQTDGKNNDSPTVLLTANVGAGIKELALKSGFYDYLSKPIEGRMLEKILLKYLPGEKIGV